MNENKFLDQLVKEMIQFEPVDAIYLYGSRAKGHARPDSDWDIGILYSTFLKDALESNLRPQNLEAHLEVCFKMYNLIHIVDAEIVPAPLQFNIITGKKLYDRGVPHVRKFENGVFSKIELDYT